MENSTTDSVTTTVTVTSDATTGDKLLLPLLITFAAIVVILGVILTFILCRKRIRAKRLREENEVKVKTVKATKNGGHQTLENEDSEGFTSISIHVPSPVNQRREEQDVERNLSSNQPASSTTAADPYVEFQNEVECYTTDSSSSQNSQDRETPSANHTNLQVEKTAVTSTPELPRIRGRRSKDNGLPAQGNLLLESKEATLRRASNIFRSDTKAFDFYMKSRTNYEMKREHLKTSRPIGRGHFGCVYVGEAAKLPNCKKRHLQVAIKTMKNSASDNDKQEFLYELEIMKLVNSLNHPNIIQLMACVTKSQPYLIVLELMSNGNLQKFLRDTKSGDVYYNLHGNSDTLNEQHLMKFALDIARGMEGIADLQLLHRDLAARNILIDENLTCKVADFGFAKDVLNKPEYKSKSVFQRPRPTRWLAPESLFTFKHSIQSDVWSYGIVLWEIVTLGNLPYPNLSTREVR